MATRGVAQTIAFVAWDTVNNVGKTGDGANFTMRWVKDGTSAALTTTTVTEIDSTNCPGLYKVSISSTEADCDIGFLHGKSSTTGISIMPNKIEFERLPNAAPGASGGVLINGSNSGTLTLGALTITGATTHTGNVNYNGTVYYSGVENFGEVLYYAPVTYQEDVYYSGLFQIQTFTVNGIFTATNSSNDIRGITLKATTGLGTQSGSVGSVSGSVGSVSGSVGSVSGSVGSVAIDGITAASISTAAGNKIADHVLRRTQANVESSSDGDAVGLSSLYGTIQQSQEVAVSGNTMTVYKTDGTTTLGTRSISKTPGDDPIRGVS